MKKILFLSIAMLIGGAEIFAQADIVDLLDAGKNDANALAKPYLEPYAEMLGAGLNNGWYNSAKPHKMLGFDVTITASYVMAPSGATSFDVQELIDDGKLTTFNRLHSSSSTSIAPTAAGKSNTRPVLTDQYGVTQLEMPNGSGMDFLPVPMVSAGVGLPMGFEVKGRLMPTVKIGDAGKVGLWGLGVQKDLKDYIPGVKHVPVLNVSALVAYTKFSSEIGVEESDNDDGLLDISASGFTTRLLVGANLPVVAFYAGLGYGNSSSDFNLLGEYAGVKDPIKLAYSSNSFDMNVGMRVRLGVLSIHADYTLGEYSAVTAGLGVSFR